MDDFFNAFRQLTGNLVSAMLTVGVEKTLWARLDDHEKAIAMASTYSPSVWLNHHPHEVTDAIQYLKQHVSGKHILQIGVCDMLFVWTAEVLSQGQKIHVVTNTPLPMWSFTYSRLRTFSHVSLTSHKEIAEYMSSLKHLESSLVILNFDKDCPADQLLLFLNGLLAIKAVVVMCNVKDPEFPNIAKVWKACSESNAPIKAKLFHRSHNVVTGGGIGVVYAEKK